MKSDIIQSILAKNWFMHPRQISAFANFFAGIVTGSISFDEDKKPFAGTIVKPTGEKVKLYFEDDQQDPEAEKPASIFDEFPKGSSLVLPLKGIMLKEDTWWSYGTETIAAYLREAASHENITSIIVDTDSGGGAVDSVSPMVDATLFARQNGTPVISWADLSASAAYYINSPSSIIVASNNISSEFGSIGVMVSFWDFAPYWRKLGLVDHVIYAPESDHKNQPYETALKGDYKLMKSEVLSPLAKKFQSDVRNFRGGKIDITQKGILNGKMYYASEAVKNGLADEIGNFDYAVKRANELAQKINN